LSVVITTYHDCPPSSSLPMTGTTRDSKECKDSLRECAARGVSFTRLPTAANHRVERSDMSNNGIITTTTSVARRMMVSNSSVTAPGRSCGSFHLFLLATSCSAVIVFYIITWGADYDDFFLSRVRRTKLSCLRLGFWELLHRRCCCE